MLIGIDVGGTYTDAVLLDDNRVEAAAKTLTKPDILESTLEALDTVLEGADKKLIERIVISTTVITNLIAGGKYDKAALLLIPGHGLNPRNYDFKTKTLILSGAIDYRGRETEPLNEAEIMAALTELADEGYRKVGIVGKFSPRNNIHEREVAGIIRRKYPDWQLELGFSAASQLNFPRRAVTTYLTLATREPYRNFAAAVTEALKTRQIEAGVFILKADGGTMPLAQSLNQPVETIFSGPAASTLGALALTPPDMTEVVVDIGGTTTDIALILNGQPLLSTKGARVNEQLTQVRTLAVKSVPLGGDSHLEAVSGRIVFHPGRLGQAYCMGGPVPTPTDALRVLGLTELGERDKAVSAMAKLSSGEGLSETDTAKRVVELMAEQIGAEVEKMFLEWEREPAYRIWELLQKKPARPSTVVGVGGAAEGFIPAIAARLNSTPVLPPYAAVANAIGAAAAKPTLQMSLRADTEAGFYQIREEGIQEKIERRSFNEAAALLLAKEKLLEKAKLYGLTVNMDELEVTYREVFNMVRDWDTTGRLFDFTVQTPRGINWRI